VSPFLIFRIIQHALQYLIGGIILKIVRKFNIHVRLIFSYLIIILFLLAVSVIGSVNLNKVNRVYADRFNSALPKLTYTDAIVKGFYDMEFLVLEHEAVMDDKVELNELYNKILGQRDVVVKLLQYFLQLSVLENANSDTSQVDTLIHGLNTDFENNLRDMFYHLNLDDMVSADGILEDVLFSYFSDFISKLTTFQINEYSTIENDIADNTKITNKTIIIFNILTIFIVLISALCAVLVIQSIKVPLLKLSLALKEISNGNLAVNIRDDSDDELGKFSKELTSLIATINNLIVDIEHVSNEIDINGNIESRINTSNYNGSYAMVTNAVNKAFDGFESDTLEIVSIISAYADGDFEKTVKRFVGKKAIQHAALDVIQGNLKSLNNDIRVLIHAATSGDLSVRTDEKKYKGDWLTLISGLNSIMFAFNEPLKELFSVLESMSNGDLNSEITGNYKGEFELMKVSVNNSMHFISSYIVEISSTLEKMSRQDLNLSIKREYRGDFVAIKDALNKIISTFNLVLNEINEASNQVAIGAGQISESSVSLALSSAQQSEEVDTLKCSIVDLLEKTNESEQNASVAESLAMKAKQKAEIGNEQMNEMLIAMSDIELASSSISNIIQVIDDIAFQTNLLALNAAVEAARAGTHGKGFSVVAEEVRNLAARSKEAASETTLLIQGTVNKVGSGTKIANITAAALQEIVEQINEFSQLVAGVSKASHVQNDAIGKISVGLNQISDITTSNTLTTEEQASSAEELSSQSALFSSMVGKFNLKQ
jgi:methyl-accepting chemotaxis protein